MSQRKEKEILVQGIQMKIMQTMNLKKGNTILMNIILILVRKNQRKILLKLPQTSK